MPALRPTTDGVVTIQPPRPGDGAVLIAGRDDLFHRFLGPGSEEPAPTGCIVVDDEIVGWVDYDEREWLEPGAVNVGYNVFASHRGKGYASRAVQLLVHHMAVDTSLHAATLLIHPGNERSLALARRGGFAPAGEVDAERLFRREVPPVAYTDGVVTIRRQRSTDLDADLAAKDDVQIDWLWLPGQREAWEAMTAAQQRAHALRGLEENERAFGTGPKWTFAVDAVEAEYVGYVDCDLANPHVPRGEANVSYSTHPAYRGRGYARRALRLVMEFVRDHTGAREAHIVVDAENAASLRVAASVGATATERWTTGEGRTMVRHVRPVREDR